MQRKNQESKDSPARCIGTSVVQYGENIISCVEEARLIYIG